MRAQRKHARIVYSSNSSPKSSRLGFQHHTTDLVSDAGMQWAGPDLSEMFALPVRPAEPLGFQRGGFAVPSALLHRDLRRKEICGREQVIRGWCPSFRASGFTAIWQRRLCLLRCCGSRSAFSWSNLAVTRDSNFHGTCDGIHVMR